jgi:hypothetical protein
VGFDTAVCPSSNAEQRGEFLERADGRNARRKGFGCAVRNDADERNAEPRAASYWSCIADSRGVGRDKLVLLQNPLERITFCYQGTNNV